MAKDRTTRAAKIQAATPRGRGGPSRIVVATVVAVLAIVAVVAVVLISSASKEKQATSGGSAVPTGAAAMGAGIVANSGVTLASGAPTLDIYEDFQCPYCGILEKSMGSTIRELGSKGQVKLVYHVLSFLDANLRNDSSVRSANAAACAADAGVFQAYHDAVFAGQPAREGAGYTDAQLVSFARQAGLSGNRLTTWQKCYGDRAHNQYVISVQDQSGRDGVTGTPTLKLNGSTLDVASLSPQSLTSAVKAATK
jgi:protein-disulfide isomerase